VLTSLLDLNLSSPPSLCSWQLGEYLFYHHVLAFLVIAEPRIRTWPLPRFQSAPLIRMEVPRGQFIRGNEFSPMRSEASDGALGYFDDEAAAVSIELKRQEIHASRGFAPKVREGALESKLSEHRHDGALEAPIYELAIRVH
jgi:hypothetical protein